MTLITSILKNATRNNYALRHASKQTQILDIEELTQFSKFVVNVGKTATRSHDLLNEEPKNCQTMFKPSKKHDTQHKSATQKCFNIFFQK